MRHFICSVLFGILLISPGTQAGALTPEQVPEPLKPWIKWVLQDNTDLSCPFIYNSAEQKRCSWPTRLTLDLHPEKGSFAIDWKVYRESWIGLPGDSQHWPLNVTVNRKTALVMDKNGVPSIKVPAGSYRIGGDFLWDSLPESLQIPADTGLIGVQVNDRAIISPAIKNGQLWLKQSETGLSKTEDSQNNLDIQVFRKVIDDVPLQVLTRLELEVSGQQREVRLDKALLDGFIPMQLQSDLPARLEADGQLLLQLRPGRWRVDLLARHVHEIDNLILNSNGQDWPASEIWVFEARPGLRMVEVTQLGAIDAGQTNLPMEWKALPAYKITRGQAMGLKVIRRGDPEPEPNQLTLNRQLWLDFSGQAYTVNDRITGKMSRGWRLNALPQTRLGRVTLNGNSQSITRLAGAGRQGVEVRNGLIDLEADSRIEGEIGNLSAAGWEQNFHSVRTELNLPPGWRLLAAGGVDNVPDTWISRWTLLDLFMVLIAALASSRLWSVPWGIFALLTLTLIWHEADAPHYIWLNILVARALLRVLPESRIVKYVLTYRNICWLVLCLIAVPFMISQLRIGLYPQLEQPWRAIAPQAEADGPQALPIGAARSVAAIRNEPAPAVAMKEEAMLRKAMQMPAAPGSGYGSMAGDYSSVNFDRIDPKAQVQTGPGLPQWQWRKIILSWNGAVDAGQQLQLWLLPPALNLLLNFLRVALLTVLALLMFGLADKLIFKIKPATTHLLIYLLILPALALPSRNSYADFPDQTLLDELKSRLLESPDCAPACAQIPQMQVKLNDKEMSIALQILAQSAVAVPLPAENAEWFPIQVQVDGEAATGLYRDNNGLWLNLNAGSHQVLMSAPAPAVNKFTLPLPLKPRHISVINTGWEVFGLQENAQAADQLQFTRMQSAPKDVENSSAKNDTAALPLPPFVRITRTLQLGLDWRLATRVTRISPADTAVVLSVPLLSGESVTTPGVRIKAGQIEVNMPAGLAEYQWQSSLEKSETIPLKAGQNSDWIEVWQADISPIWHPEASGIAMMHQDNSGRWRPEWHPWPGEELTLKITRPETVAGQSQTIDSSNLSVKPGQRSQEANLNFSLRSSQGGQHSITLPDQALLQTVTINGQSQPIRPEGRKLTFPINPGKQQIAIGWQQPGGITGLLNTPTVDLESVSVNCTLNMALGQDRWVLLTVGPGIGPAVLFWGVILVICLLAAGLCKIPLTPLKYRHWLLLLLGLSQIEAAAAAVVIGWLMLIGWRGQEKVKQPRLFNLLQAAIVFITLLALGLLFLAVEQGLLGSPDMQITGNQSSAFNLNWYQDRSLSTLPIATVVSVPLIVYRLLMLAWSLWLAVSLLDWLKWGWNCFASQGLWITIEKPVKAKQTPESAKKAKNPDQ